jgi:hypothetical protein
MIYEYAEPWWNNTDSVKPKSSEKSLSSATLSTINLTWTEMSMKMGLRGERSTTNLLSHGTAQRIYYGTLYHYMRSNMLMVSDHSNPDRGFSSRMQYDLCQRFLWSVVLCKKQP